MRVASVVFLWGDRQIATFDAMMADQLPMPGFVLGVALTVGELCGWLQV